VFNAYDTMTKLFAVLGVTMLVVGGVIGGVYAARCIILGAALLGVAAWRHFTD